VSPSVRAVRLRPHGHPCARPGEDDFEPLNRAERRAHERALRRSVARSW
jgi:hypothetical protein